MAEERGPGPLEFVQVGDKTYLRGAWPEAFVASREWLDELPQKWSYFDWHRLSMWLANTNATYVCEDYDPGEAVHRFHRLTATEVKPIPGDPTPAEQAAAAETKMRELFGPGTVKPEPPKGPNALSLILGKPRVWRPEPEVREQVGLDADLDRTIEEVERRVFQRVMEHQRQREREMTAAEITRQMEEEVRQRQLRLDQLRARGEEQERLTSYFHGYMQPVQTESASTRNWLQAYPAAWTGVNTLGPVEEPMLWSVDREIVRQVDKLTRAKEPLESGYQVQQVRTDAWVKWAVEHLTALGFSIGFPPFSVQIKDALDVETPPMENLPPEPPLPETMPPGPVAEEDDPLPDYFREDDEGRDDDADADAEQPTRSIDPEVEKLIGLIRERIEQQPIPVAKGGVDVGAVIQAVIIESRKRWGNGLNAWDNGGFGGSGGNGGTVGGR